MMLQATVRRKSNEKEDNYCHIIIIIMFIKYIIDPRASKDPREIIRDKLECRELIKPLDKHKNEKILGIIPFCTSAQCMKYGQPNYDPFKKCLTNRGHSILN